MSSKNRYDSEENPFNNPFKNPDQNQPVKKEMSGCRLIVLIALGILLASFVGCVASLTFTGAVIKGVGDAFEKSTADAEKQEELLKKQYVNKATKIIKETNQMLVPILPIQRSEIVRQNSEKAVMQARTETQSFDSIYKKPAECYDMKDSEIRIKCANNYMSARKAFNEKKMVRINKEDETISLNKTMTETREVCYEKSTGRRVSCGNDYIIEKSAFNKN